ncbi:condensation domain-containing protein [Actinoalloteichus spitiensis]|uniref:condensation domain-containing protein n=1 Tax=Actinoalloteichus spitiensis TaxID=252394 RepID=UPI00035CE13E|nr:condensation domain-containing protein [Actinoalloteichus spitiensis]
MSQEKEAGNAAGSTGTVEELLQRRMAGRARRRRTSIGSVPRADPPLLSYEQRRLWFLDGLVPGSVAYTVPSTTRFRGPLDLSAFRSATDAVVARHETLRSRFDEAAGEPFHRVDEDGGTEFTVEDLSGHPDPERRAREVLADEHEVPFDLRTGPLLRTRVLRLGPEDHVVSTVFHHIVFDRDSLAIWNAELGEAYTAYQAGRAPNLPPLPAQFPDFAAWQRQTLTEERIEDSLRHWVSRLAGTPAVLELPADHPRPEMPSHHAGVLDFVVPGDVSDRVRALAERRGTTVFTVALAAFHVLLGRYTGLSQVLTGYPSNGRTEVELEGLVGFFANSLPAHGDLSGNPTFEVLLDRTHDTLLHGHQHRAVPFDRLVDRLVPVRDLSRNPLVQVWFDVATGGGSRTASLPGVEASTFDVGSAHTRFDVEIHVEDHRPAPLGGRVFYARDLFDPDTMRRFAHHYTVLLASLVTEPGRRISRAELLDPAERDRLLAWGSAPV